MAMNRIINIVDNLSKLNYGIWNAAINTTYALREHHGFISEVWFPALDNIPHHLLENSYPEPLKDLSIECIPKLIKQKGLNPENDIIITHGCWRFPSKWGNAFKTLGFSWVYTPHGMLEPWSMQLKWLKKRIYFNLVEKRLAQKADVVRAVGLPEHKNLSKQFHNVTLIPNGVAIPAKTVDISTQRKRTLLFIGRLHHKKGVALLAEAWQKSQLNNNPNYELKIIGPDEGELEKMKPLMDKCNNASYLGAIWGADKVKLLENASFFILPTFSEGFPTSVVEAMQYGLIPITTDGCNFPEAFEHNLAIRTEPKTSAILNTLNLLPTYSTDQLTQLGYAIKDFARKHYSTIAIATQQAKIYSQLLKK